MSEEGVDDPIKDRFNDFAEEMQKLGKKLEKEGVRLSKKLNHQEKQMETWFHKTFGVLGPLLSSFLGLIVLGIIIWIFALIGSETGNSIFTSISNLLLNNIIWLFSASLLISFTEYGNRKAPYVFKWFSPLTTALGLAILLWILANIYLIIENSMNIHFFTGFASFIINQITAFFIMLLLLSYLLFFSIQATKTMQHPLHIQHDRYSETKQFQKATYNSDIKRLFRSGKDKILGGVCGGIAEYLSIDPVIVRILWIIATLFWGTGILLYIILWIIIPRNPNHKWF